MEQHVVAQPVITQRVVDHVGTERHPIVLELLRTQHQHIAVARLEILDHRQRGERLTQTHRIRQNAPVERLQLVDDRQHRVPLEVVQLVPDHTLAVARALLGQHVLVDVLQKLAEDPIQGHVIHQFGRILPIHLLDVVKHRLGHILQLSTVPRLIELVDEAPGLHGIHLGYPRIRGGAVADAQLRRGELLERHIRGRPALALHAKERGEAVVVLERHEPGLLTSDPFSALHRDGLLRQLVTQPDLQLGPVQTLLALKAGNIELALLLRRLLSDERLRRENEPEPANTLQLLPKLAIRIHRKQRRCDGNPIALPYRPYQIILDQRGPVIDKTRTHHISKVYRAKSPIGCKVCLNAENAPTGMFKI